MSKSEKIDEQWHIGLDPAPYRIGRAPGFARDETPQLNMQHQLRQAEEALMFFQKEQMVAQLEVLKEPLSDLFKQIVFIKNVLEERSHYATIEKSHIKTIKKIDEKLDSMSEVLVNEIIPLLDNLVQKKVKNS